MTTMNLLYSCFCYLQPLESSSGQMTPAQGLELDHLILDPLVPLLLEMGQNTGTKEDLKI